MAMDLTKTLMFFAGVGFMKRRREERRQQAAAERQADLQGAFDKLAAECIPNYEPQTTPADK